MSAPARPARHVPWIAVLALHVLVAAVWWFLEPHGFPFAHPRFWLNTALPFGVLVFALVIAGGGERRGELVTALPAFHLAAALALRAVFPVTFERLWLAPLTVGLALAALAAIFHRPRTRMALGPAVVGAVVGVLAVWAERGAEPMTHPVEAHHELPSASEPPPYFTQVGPLAFSVTPHLRFISRSPDRSWTVLAPGETLTASAGERYEVTADTAPDGALHLDARTGLPRAVYSHLNTFTEVTIDGAERLFVSFSPAPDVRIEVLPSDYPTGRPLRFAYVDADRRFRVVEASDAEKGPFHELASGVLLPTDPLTLTVYDGETPHARITLEDFAAQASTQLSPTAGWGVPENSIELRRWSESPWSTVTLYFTLASTSVGRGWESVGHAPGVYRNRIHVAPP